jgi:succinate dehydrogenase / fumarate reductase flavoprotein subunit
MPISGDPGKENEERVNAFMSNSGGENVEDIAQELKTTMTNNCGIFRDEEKLTQALKDIKQLQERFKNASIMDKTSRFNTDVLAAIETEHLLTFSEVIVASAQERKESRGAHSRTDYTKRDDENWIKHILATKDKDSPEPTLSFRDVYIDWEKHPPQERKY